MQQGDVRLFQTNDDGDISVVNGTVEMNGGLETSVYLSMFGGNLDDPGEFDVTAEWWGNKITESPSMEYRSETQYMLKSIPATTGNMRKVEEAIRRDLAWLKEDGVASDISASVYMTELNKILIKVVVTAYGEGSEFTYSANWKASS